MKILLAETKKWLCCAIAVGCCFSGAAAGNPVGGGAVSGSSLLSATVTLSNLNYTYDGTQKSANCDTVPLGLTTVITYSDLGSGVGLRNAGSYGVNCTVTDAGYNGGASGTLIIVPLASVIWTGGSGGNWSDAANWAGGALPDVPNVLAVTIPTGVTVTYDSGVVGDTMLNTLSNSGNLVVDAGTLNIAGTGTLTVGSYNGTSSNYGTQASAGTLTATAGTLTNAGSLTLSDTATQATIGAVTIISSGAGTASGATVNTSCLTCATIVPIPTSTSVFPPTFAPGTISVANVIAMGITFSPTVLTVGGATTATVTFTDGAGNPASAAPVVSLSSTTPDICTVNANTISSIVSGTCILGIAFDNTVIQGYNIIAGSTLNLLPSWNLLGNSIYATLDVAATFGDTNKVSSVWKWSPTTGKWAFYTPSLAADTLASYAASKGYDVLSTIDAGEGFWVNATTAFTATLPTGASVDAISLQNQPDPAQDKLLKGWSLVAMGDNVTPSAFNMGLSATQPEQGVIPLNVTSLWSWDSALSNWYFYAPSLETQGGTALVDYITGKGYLDFTSSSKTLGQGVGFWVNKP
jgi:hypothetical protein